MLSRVEIYMHIRPDRSGYVHGSRATRGGGRDGKAEAEASEAGEAAAKRRRRRGGEAKAAREVGKASRRRRGGEPQRRRRRRGVGGGGGKEGARGVRQRGYAYGAAQEA